MIRSMTGYGRGSSDLRGMRATVELRSVNNRFADLRFRLPPELGPMEPEIRRLVLGRVRRGRVEVNIRFEPLEGGEPRPLLNRQLLRQVLQASVTLQQEFHVEGKLDLSTVLALPGMLRPDTIDDDELAEQREALTRALEQGLEALDLDRRREGAELQAELLTRLRRMKTLAGEVRQRAATLPATLRDRIVDRLGALGGEVPLEPQRVAQEAAVLADRCDVTEELVRLDGHLDQAAALLDEPDGAPVGKRLEFLLQEIHRETNTISSKSADLDLTRGALDLKVEAEKVREQIQNLE